MRIWKIVGTILIALVLIVCGLGLGGIWGFLEGNAIMNVVISGLLIGFTTVVCGALTETFIGPKK